jgi:hypothetical protein
MLTQGTDEVTAADAADCMYACSVRLYQVCSHIPLTGRCFTYVHVCVLHSLSVFEFTNGKSIREKYTDKRTLLGILIAMLEQSFYTFVKPGRKVDS